MTSWFRYNVFPISLSCMIMSACGATVFGNQPQPAVGGVVVDESNQPVANAKVTLYYHRSWTGFGNEVVEAVSSDKAGHFRFDHRYFIPGSRMREFALIDL